MNTHAGKQHTGALNAIRQFAALPAASSDGDNALEKFERHARNRSSPSEA